MSDQSPHSPSEDEYGPHQSPPITPPAVLPPEIKQLLSGSGSAPPVSSPVTPVPPQVEILPPSEPPPPASMPRSFTVDYIAPPSIPPPPLEENSENSSRLFIRRGTADWSSSSARSSVGPRSRDLSDGGSDTLSFSPGSSGSGSPVPQRTYSSGSQEKPRCVSMCLDSADIPPPPMPTTASTISHAKQRRPSFPGVSSLNDTVYVPPPSTPPPSISGGDETPSPNKTRPVSAAWSHTPRTSERRGHMPRLSGMRGSAARLSIVQFSREMYNPYALGSFSLKWSNFNDLLEQGSKNLTPVLQFPDLMDDVSLHKVDQHPEQPLKHLTMEDVEKLEPVAEKETAEDLCRDFVVIDRRRLMYRAELLNTSQAKSQDPYFVSSDDPHYFFFDRVVRGIDVPVSPSFAPSSASMTGTSSSASDTMSVDSSISNTMSEAGNTPNAEGCDKSCLKQQAIDELVCDPPVLESLDKVQPKLESRMQKSRRYDITLNVKALQVSSGSFGPVFCTLAVYDCQERRKVSEDCHFHVNSKHALAEIGLNTILNPKELDDISINTMLVSLPMKSKDYWAVICGYTLIHDGDLEKEVSSSQRGKLDITALRSELKDIVEANKEHGWDGIPKQPLFWCPIPLFQDSDIGPDIMCSVYTTTSLIMAKGVLTDDVLYQVVSDPDRLKKFKTMPGLLELIIDEKPNEIMKIDPMLYPTFSKKDARAHIKDKKQKVINMFYPVVMPYLDYENLMYVYPENVSVKSSPGASTNLLQVSVQLLSKTQMSIGQTDGVRCVYPPMYSYRADGKLHRPKFGKEGFCSVHSKDREFSDEIKLQLPLSLQDMCLVFTFYGVTMRSENKKISRFALGFAAIELMPDINGCPILLQNGRYTLPVVLSLSELTGANIHPVTDVDPKKQKHTFTFHVHSHSTCFVKDPGIYSLLTRAAIDAAEAAGKTVAIKKKKELPNDVLNKLLVADRVQCSLHLYSLLRCLLQCMCLWVDDVENSRKCFFHILMLLEKVFSSGGGSGSGGALEKSFSTSALVQVNKNTPALSYFISMMFDPSKIPQKEIPLHELLIRYWLDLMHKSRLEKQLGITADSQFNWFLLRMISKSATIYTLNEREKNPNGPKIVVSQSFEMGTVDLLKELLNRTASRRRDSSIGGRGANFSSGIVTIADFIKEMFPVMHAGLLFELVQDFLNGIDPQNTDAQVWLSVKFVFLNTLVKYENFVQLNLPLLPDESQIKSLNDIEPLFRTNHPLIGLILNQLSLCLDGEKEDIQLSATKLVRNMLQRTLRDRRFQNDAVRERIATMYFPLLLTGLSQTSSLIIASNTPKQQNNIMLMSILWILKHCSESLLHTWWQKDTVKGHELFFSLLAHCIEFFKGKPHQQEAILIACRCILAFLKDHADSMDGAKNALFDAVMECTTRSLASAGELALPNALNVVSELLKRYPAHFCVHLGNAYLNTVSFEILRRVSESELPPALFSKFAETFYLQLTCVFQHAVAESQNGGADLLESILKRVRSRIVVAMSNLVGEGSVTNTTHLPKFFAAIDTLCQNDTSDFTKETQFQDLISYTNTHMKSLLDLHTKIVATTEPDTLKDLYIEALRFNEENPEMRIRWLRTLANKCKETSNWEEAAQCDIIQAYLISRYLTDICHGHFKKADFSPLIPNLGSEVTRIDTKVAEECGLFQGDVWSLEYLVDLLRSASDLLKKGGYFEQCIEVTSFITSIWKRKRNYGKMSVALAETEAVCTACAEKEKERENFLFARYYRVAFYGKRLGDDLRGKEFIYKRPPSEVIAVVQQHIRSFLAQKVGDEKLVELLPNIDLDLSKLDPEKVYFQMCNTDPYLSDKHDVATSFDRHFGAREFLAVQAYSGEGSTKNRTESLREQRKKKVVYSTELAFPFVKNRLRVVRTRTAILEPIENAIELALERCERLITQLENNPPRIKQLQQILQGSVAVMVNKGVPEICEIFLGEEGRAREDPVLVKKLGTAISNFIELSAAALQLNSTLIGPEQIKFQNMLVQQYSHLCTTVLPYIKQCGCREPKTTYSLEDAERNVWRELPPVTLDVKFTETPSFSITPPPVADVDDD